MSVKIFPSVLYLRMAARRKLVLAVLAEHADSIGRCWPSQALLAHRASISRRKLFDHLQGLQDDGWLNIQIGQGPGGVNIYRLNLNKIIEGAKAEELRIKSEKEQHWLNLTETPFTTPDFQDTPPDPEDIPPDLQNITQDFESIPPGPVGPTEPSRNHKESKIKTKEEPSGQIFKKIPTTPEITPEAKESLIDRLRGWAELEQDDSSFSYQQGISLNRALSEACTSSPQSELLIELLLWDFLDSENKDKWKERIEAQYKPVEISGGEVCRV